jgi:hypothetical protein
MRKLEEKSVHKSLTSVTITLPALITRRLIIIWICRPLRSFIFYFVKLRFLHTHSQAFNFRAL